VKVTGVILCPVPKNLLVHGPKCPLCRGYRIVVLKDRLDNETAMFTGPTHGIY